MEHIRQSRPDSGLRTCPISGVQIRSFRPSDLSDLRRTQSSERASVQDGRRRRSRRTGEQSYQELAQIAALPDGRCPCLTGGDGWGEQEWHAWVTGVARMGARLRLPRQGDGEEGAPAWHAWVTVSVVVAMLLCFVREVRTPPTVAFSGMVLVWNLGIISTKQALGGFSNAGLLAVGVLFVVVQSVERSGLPEFAARQIFGAKSSVTAGLARMTTFCFLISAFLNNTPIVALFAPIVRDWARNRGYERDFY